MICTHFSKEMAQKEALKSFKFTGLIEKLEFTVCSVTIHQLVIFNENDAFCGTTNTPGLLVMSALGFKARVNHIHQLDIFNENDAFQKTLSKNTHIIK